MHAGSTVLFFSSSNNMQLVNHTANHAAAEDRCGLRQRPFRHRVDFQARCVLNEGWKIKGQKSCQVPSLGKEGNRKKRKGQKIKGMHYAVMSVSLSIIHAMTQIAIA